MCDPWMTSYVTVCHPYCLHSPSLSPSLPQSCFLTLSSPSLLTSHSLNFSLSCSVSLSTFSTPYSFCLLLSHFLTLLLSPSLTHSVSLWLCLIHSVSLCLTLPFPVCARPICTWQLQYFSFKFYSTSPLFSRRSHRKPTRRQRLLLTFTLCCHFVSFSHVYHAKPLN